MRKFVCITFSLALAMVVGVTDQSYTYMADPDDSVVGSHEDPDNTGLG